MTPAASRLGLSARPTCKRINSRPPAKVEPTQLLSSQIAAIHSAVITTCPLVRKQAQEFFYIKTSPRQKLLIFLIAGPSKLHSHFHSRSVALLIQHLRPPPNLASRPRQPHLAQEAPFQKLHQQSHQQVNRYICVICISHPTQTTSDTSRLSSCNHFAYRGNLVAHTSVATANTPPPRRMSR